MAEAEQATSDGEGDSGPPSPVRCGPLAEYGDAVGAPVTEGRAGLNASPEETTPPVPAVHGNPRRRSLGRQAIFNATFEVRLRAPAMLSSPHDAADETMRHVEKVPTGDAARLRLYGHGAPRMGRPSARE